MGFRTWLYHKDCEAKIVDSDEVPELSKQGWVDNPAKVNDIPIQPNYTETKKREQK